MSTAQLQTVKMCVPEGFNQLVSDILQSKEQVINKQSCVTKHLPGEVHPLLYDFFRGETSAYDPNKIRLKSEQKYFKGKKNIIKK